MGFPVLLFSYAAGFSETPAGSRVASSCLHCRFGPVALLCRKGAPLVRIRHGSYHCSRIVQPQLIEYQRIHCSQLVRIDLQQSAARELPEGRCCPRGRPHCVALYGAFRAGACAKAQRHCAAGGREGSEERRISSAHQQVVIVPTHAYEHEHVYEYKHEYAYGNSYRPFETYPFKLPLAW